MQTITVEGQSMNFELINCKNAGLDVAIVTGVRRTFFTVFKRGKIVAEFEIINQ